MKHTYMIPAAYIIITGIYVLSLFIINRTNRKEKKESGSPAGIIAAPQQYVVNIIENTKDLSQIGFADLTLSLNEIIARKNGNEKPEPPVQQTDSRDINFEELIHIKTN